MPLKLYSHYSIMALLGLCLLTAACGKKSEETVSLETYRPPLTTQQEEFLSKQDIACEPGKFCPEYMVKIVVFESGLHRVCTGFLTDSQTVATSTSCLPAVLRLKDQDCSRDIFFFLPKTFSTNEVVRRSCSRVLKVSLLDSDNPILWRDDLAFLSLDQPVYRRSLFPTREGMPNKTHLTMWSVDHIDDYFSLIRRDICEVVHNTYFNQLASGEYSPGMTVAGCPFKRGNSGAPLIDDTGLVRAIISTTAGQGLIDYVNASGLLTSPLKLIHNTTNFACAPTIYDSEVASESECSKEMNIRAADAARANMMSYQMIFAEPLESLKAELEKSNKFVRFSVKVTSKEGNFQTTVTTPKCFKDVALWIDTLSGSEKTFDISLPVKRFKITMDGYARIRGQELKEESQSFKLQFSPAYLRTHEGANLYMWNRTGTVDEIFENLPKCN